MVEVASNDLDETTEVVLKKGNTGELVRRHVSSIIPYMEVEDSSRDPPINRPSSRVNTLRESGNTAPSRAASNRAASIRAAQNIRDLAESNQI